MGREFDASFSAIIVCIYLSYDCRFEANAHRALLAAPEHDRSRIRKVGYNRPSSHASENLTCSIFTVNFPDFQEGLAGQLPSLGRPAAACEASRTATTCTPSGRKALPRLRHVSQFGVIADTAAIEWVACRSLTQPAAPRA